MSCILVHVVIRYSHSKGKSEYRDHPPRGTGINGGGQIRPDKKINESDNSEQL
nr:MAG TPA: hypothetical protein [Caudoviricetes sp.]